MNNAELEAIVEELRETLVGRRFGKVFPLGRRLLAIDFRLSGSRYLFIAAEAASPRMYLVKRRLKDVERESENPQPFHLLLKKHLSGSEVVSIKKLPNDRIVIFHFIGISEIGKAVSASLVAQLTGKSSNLFILDANDHIIGSLVEKDLDGQRFGELYSPPPTRQNAKSADPLTVNILPEDDGSMSAGFDRLYTEREAEERFKSRALAAERDLEREIAKREKLIARLKSDREQHGDADKWKRYGDLILANLSTAKRSGDKISVIDYFDETAPQIEIEADENASLTDSAQKYFRKYTKAQNAAVEIGRRISAVKSQLSELQNKREKLAQAVNDRDEAFFDTPAKGNKETRRDRKEKQRFSGARQFTSSDGFEILVGKKATDNDYLTFRMAGSLDTWLHAADYSGSHVVIRNPNRKEIPNRTLLEAAQLAAFYSSGKSQPKAAVHYTQKKFVNKPKGAAPGLVRLASFKTILVEPVIPSALDQKKLI